MLASVARHSEQKRSLTIPQVARNATEQFQNVGTSGYNFNPNKLLSSLTNEE